MKNCVYNILYQYFYLSVGFVGLVYILVFVTCNDQLVSDGAAAIDVVACVKYDVVTGYSVHVHLEPGLERSQASVSSYL